MSTQSRLEAFLTGLQARYQQAHTRLTLDQRRTIRPAIAAFSKTVSQREVISLAMARADSASHAIAHDILDSWLTKNY